MRNESRLNDLEFGRRKKLRRIPLIHRSNSSQSRFSRRFSRNQGIRLSYGPITAREILTNYAETTKLNRGSPARNRNHSLREYTSASVTVPLWSLLGCIPPPLPLFLGTAARQSSVFSIFGCGGVSLTYQDSHFCSRDIPGASRSELDADCRRFVALYTRHTFAFATRARHTVPPTLHLFVRVENDHDRRTTPLWERHTTPLPHASRKRPSPWATVSFSSSSEGSPLGPAVSESHCHADTPRMSRLQC